MKNLLKPELKPFSMPDNQYRAIDAVSSTDLKMLSVSPRKLWLYKQGKIPSSPAMDLGTMIHSAILEPENFTARYVTEPGELPDGRIAGIGPKETHINKNTTEWKAYIGEWRLKNVDKIQVSSDEFELLRRIMTAVHSHPIANKLVKTHLKEQVALWTDDDTGLKCKGRADLIGECLIDFKTTTCGTPKEFERECYNRSIHSQMAFYDKGFTLNGCDFKRHYVIGVEKAKQGESACLVMEVSRELLERGHENNKRLMDKYIECTNQGVWPGFDETYLMQIPAYALVDFENG